jgi:hypothetical protein
MLEEVVPELGKVLDRLANTDEGLALTDDLATLLARLYQSLVGKGILAEHAAMMVSGFARSTSGK